jgi:hypothetical protein
MGHYDDILSPVVLPRMVAVKQQFDDRKIDDIPGAVGAVIEGFPGISQIYGKNVALAVGSRGIANLASIVQMTVSCLKQHGARVFIVPAMGSHGGARAENQETVFRHMGVTEEAVGAPIRSSMETMVIGQANDGTPVHCDRYAAEADFTVTVARIKPHTGFRGRFESGMTKMCVIGLGKQKGADYCHSQGLPNMAANLEKIGRVFIQKSNLLFSLGIIENSYDETLKILAVPKEAIMAREPALLEEAKSYLPGIPFDNLDLLVVDEFGKNIAGSGMDCNIIQRFTTDYMNRSARPFVKRIVTLRLTPESDGNATGFALADISTRRAFESMSFEHTYPNSLTSRVVFSSHIPMIMETDFDAIRAGIKTAPDANKELRIVRIRNTLCLDKLEISEALIPEAREKKSLEVSSELFLWRFDKEGNLTH